MVRGEELRALRRARGWDIPDAVRELWQVSGGPPTSDNLEQTWRAWERGTQQPSERYELLLRKLFPGGIDPDPAGVLDQARMALERAGTAIAGRAASPELAELSRQSAELCRQITEKAERLAELLDRQVAAVERRRELLDAQRERAARRRELFGGAVGDER